MSPRAGAGAVLAAAVLLGLVGSALRAQQDAGDDVVFDEADLRRILKHSPLGDPPPDPTNAVADDERAARLGQRLFFDPRLSLGGEVSCASCHDPAQGFADGRTLSEGLGTGARHSQSLWNAAYQRWYFWDGRADTLWSQALQPLENPTEMGGDRLSIARTLALDATLAEEYVQVFGPLPELSDPRWPAQARPDADPEHPLARAWAALGEADRAAIDRVFANVGKSLAAYERRLVSRRSPFDRFVEGLREGDPDKRAALSKAERRGLKLFVGRAHCRLCHGGPTFSDGEFHDIGIGPLAGGAPTDAGRHAGAARVLADPFNALGEHSDERDGEAADKLRHLAREPRNWGEFKTPTLRNVARTAPYMHQGQLASLRDVLRYYSTLEGMVQLGHHTESILVPLELSAAEIDELAAFLGSLTDEGVDPGLLAPPAR